jgi:phosphoribosyl 1,2-cyclic phosphodiesterase
VSPETSTTTVVHLLGVRGSTPATGASFLELGGSTSCLAVEPDDQAGAWLVLDAGTGFRNLAPRLGPRALRADVVLTHLHWDHVQGLPFLANADRDDAHVELWVPARPDEDDAAALERLARGFSPPHFPIRPDELRGDWRFHALHAGALQLDGRTVRVAEIAHKGGVTMGVRVEDGGRSFAYLPDHAVSTADAGQLAHADTLAADVDVLFHGGPYLAAEQATATDFGHSTVQDAVDLALRNHVGRLVLVHHAPHRTDDQIDVVLAEARAHVARRGAELDVAVGVEGATVTI